MAREFCLLNFSAQESENVDTLSFNLCRLEIGISKDLVVAIDFLTFNDSRFKFEVPFNSCWIFNSTIDRLFLTHDSGKFIKSKALLHPIFSRRLESLLPIPHISLKPKNFRDFILLSSVSKMCTFFV